MRNRITYIFILVVSFLITNAFLCTKKSNLNSINSCDSINKIDTLIQQIVSKDYIFMTVTGDTSKIDYLVTNEFIQKGKEFTGIGSRKIITMNRSKIESLYGGIIYIDRIYFNIDTTIAELKVVYFILGKYRATTTLFKYNFDTNNCKWILEDSTLFLH